MAVKPATNQTSFFAVQAASISSSKSTMNMPATVTTSVDDAANMFSAMDVVLSPSGGSSSQATDQAQPPLSTGDPQTQNIPFSTAGVAETSRITTTDLPRKSQAENISAVNSQTAPPAPASAMSHGPSQAPQTTQGPPHMPSTTTQDLSQALHTTGPPQDQHQSEIVLYSESATSQTTYSQDRAEWRSSNGQATDVFSITVAAISAVKTSQVPIATTSFLTASASLPTASTATEHDSVRSGSTTTGVLTLKTTTTIEPVTSSSSPAGSSDLEPSSRKSGRDKAAVAAGVSVGCLIFLILIGICIIHTRRRRKRRYSRENTEGILSPLSGPRTDREGHRIALPKTRAASAIGGFAKALKAIAAKRADASRGGSTPIPALPTYNEIDPDSTVPHPPAATTFFERPWDKYKLQAPSSQTQEVAERSVPHPGHLQILGPLEGVGEFTPLNIGQEERSTYPHGHARDTQCDQREDATDPFTDAYYRSYAASCRASETVSSMSDKQPCLLSSFEQCRDNARSSARSPPVSTPERVRRGRSDPFDLERIVSMATVSEPSPTLQPERAAKRSDESTTPLSIVSSLEGFEEVKLPEGQTGGSGERSDIGYGGGSIGDRNRESRSSIDSDVLGTLYRPCRPSLTGNEE